MTPTAPSLAALNLRRLLSVRLAMIGIMLLATIAVLTLAELPLQWRPVAAVAVLLLLLTGASALRLVWQPAHVREPELTLQLVVDVLGLATLLYFSGGWTNPLVSLFLVPIAVAVITVEQREAWLIALLTIASYSLLTLFYRPLLPFAHDASQGFTLHVAGMWLTFVLSAVLIAYFGTTMVETLRSKDRALAQEREENLRNEQIVGLATLAAGTAHELSTPLNSIAVIAEELQHMPADEQRAALALLQNQVSLCRENLQQLRETARGDTGAQLQPLDQFLYRLKERLALLHPRMVLRLHWPRETSERPYINADPRLSQALLNLLDNAAAASRGPIDCQLQWTDEHLDIAILDQGPGFGGAIETAAGKGLGVGLLLANASIERAGGTVNIAPRDDRPGTRVSVRLPAGTVLVEARKDSP